MKMTQGKANSCFSDGIAGDGLWVRWSFSPLVTPVLDFRTLLVFRQ
jgi:hypothetical protein